jgi:hypothetical protein
MGGPAKEEAGASRRGHVSTGCPRGPPATAKGRRTWAGRGRCYVPASFLELAGLRLCAIADEKRFSSIGGNAGQSGWWSLRICPSLYAVGHN